MFELKHSLTFIFFISASLALIMLSFVGQWDGGAFKDFDQQDRVEATKDSNFIKADYFTINEDGPLMRLEAKELMFNNSVKRSFALAPEGIYYTSDRKIVNYRGQRGLFDEKLQKLTLEGDVFVETGETKASSHKMFYFTERDFIELFDSVKSSTYHVEQKDYIEVEGDYAWIKPEKEVSFFRGDVKGLIRRDRRYEESLYFWSDTLTTRLKASKVDLLGNVRVKKQLLTADSRRGEIFLENYNKKLKYFVLYDDVKVVEKVVLEGQPMKRLAFAEKLEGMMSESKAILTGYPRVYQQKDVIKGNKIILRENTEVIEVIDANTNILIKD